MSDTAPIGPFHLISFNIHPHPHPQPPPPPPPVDKFGQYSLRKKKTSKCQHKNYIPSEITGFFLSPTEKDKFFQTLLDLYVALAFHRLLNQNVPVHRERSHSHPPSCRTLYKIEENWYRELCQVWFLHLRISLSLCRWCSHLIKCMQPWLILVLMLLS